MGNQKNKKVNLGGKWFWTVLPIFLMMVFFGFENRNAYSASGGVPGTGNLNFNPGADTENNHCINPAGVDLNSEDWYGLSEQIMGPAFCSTPPFSGHFVVNSGEFAVAPLRWIVNNAPAEGEDDLVPLLYPEGYEPACSSVEPDDCSPVADALAKFTSIRVTVDDKKEYVYAAEDIVRITSTPFGFPNEFYQIFYLPRIPPQAVGDHVLKYYWTVSDTLCNGWSLACLPTGENPFLNGGISNVINFTVVPGANRAH